MYRGYERPMRVPVQRDFMGLNSSLPSPSSSCHSELNLSPNQGRISKLLTRKVLEKLRGCTKPLYTINNFIILTKKSPNVISRPLFANKTRKEKLKFFT